MKILIASLSAGTGHVRAAEAILAACKEISPSIEAVHVDVANFVSPHLRRLYVDGYRVAVHHAPNLWGHIYRMSDHPVREGVFTPLLYRFQRSSAHAFYSYIERFRPDVILATHFLIPQLIEAERHHPSFGPPVETVITDYDVHQFWISKVATRYYVAHEGMVNTLERAGIAPSQVVVSGIPILPNFLRPTSASLTRHKLELDDKRPVILMLSGGLGINELEGAVKRLLVLPGAKQIVTVSGNNVLLKYRLDRLNVPVDTTLINLGYVHNMPELLDISDLVITKPGGLTVAECLAKKKLMLLFSPIPGQEEKNAEFLVSRHAGMRAHSLDELPQKVSLLLSQPALTFSYTRLRGTPRAASGRLYHRSDHRSRVLFGRMTLHLAAVFLGAFIWAKLEVEIEGKDGWAKNLPTWRIEKHILLDVFMGGRPLTGFHTWAFSFVAFAFHLPLVWMRTWSVPLESEVLGCLMLFWVVEDFFWFIINPHYGWHKYREQKIVWHPSWFWILPADHWAMIAISFGLLAWSHYKS